MKLLTSFKCHKWIIWQRQQHFKYTFEFTTVRFISLSQHFNLKTHNMVWLSMHACSKCHCDSLRMTYLTGVQRHSVVCVWFLTIGTFDTVTLVSVNHSYKAQREQRLTRGLPSWLSVGWTKVVFSCVCLNTC